jgi:phosphatidylinositol glycan class F
MFGAPVLNYWTMGWSLLQSAYSASALLLVYNDLADAGRSALWGSPNEDQSFVLVTAAGSLFGAWFGAIVVPLDWGQGWQMWPVCSVYGCLAGYVLSACVLTFYRTISSVW